MPRPQRRRAARCGPVRPAKTRPFPAAAPPQAIRRHARDCCEHASCIVHGHGSQQSNYSRMTVAGSAAMAAMAAWSIRERTRGTVRTRDMVIGVQLATGRQHCHDDAFFPPLLATKWRTLCSSSALTFSGTVAVHGELSRGPAPCAYRRAPRADSPSYSFDIWLTAPRPLVWHAVSTPKGFRIIGTQGEA